MSVGPVSMPHPCQNESALRVFGVTHGLYVYPYGGLVSRIQSRSYPLVTVPSGPANRRLRALHRDRRAINVPLVRAIAGQLRLPERPRQSP